MSQVLLSIGHGYSAAGLAKRLLARTGWTVIGTTRTRSHVLRAQGVTPLVWPDQPLPLAAATHLLTSVAPGQGGDPVLAAYGAELRQAKHLRWVGYLSTVGVYGDAQGGWVDEESANPAQSPRAIARLAAEAAWAEVCAAAGVRLHIFRLGGIYGPGRGPFQKLRDGRAQRVIKPNQYFSRIHQDDIGQALDLAIQSDAGLRIWNLVDDLPAPPQDVLQHAAELAGLAIPPEVPFDQADLSPMARAFYADSKRVRNDRIKADLGLQLLYPDYDSGLRAILAAEGG
jgi:nucleoside-diphosphate-sugar epimerase